MPTITNYQEFVRKNRKYSRNPQNNLSRHGFHFLCESDLDAKERSKDYVLKYIAMVGESKYSEYVYYRTTEAWGLPYIFLYGK